MATRETDTTDTLVRQAALAVKESALKLDSVLVETDAALESLIQAAIFAAEGEDEEPDLTGLEAAAEAVAKIGSALIDLEREQVRLVDLIGGQA